MNISTIKILAEVKKFPGKREIQKSQISWEVSRPDFPGGNTSYKPYDDTACDISFKLTD